MTWVEQLRAHEAVFRRAPSAHNTQPWQLEYHADEVAVTVDPARSLPDSDPTGRDLDLGIGAFVETCLIVSAGLGLAVTAVPGPRLVPAAKVYSTPFTIADVEARRVARGRYAPGPLDPAVLAELGPGLAHVPARELVRDLAVADRWMFGTPAVALELRDWLRLDPRHPRYHLDGLTDRALVLSRFEARFLATALHAYPVTRRLGLATLLATSGRSLLRYDGSVLVLLADGTDRVTAGRRLLRTWLALARHGLAVHPLSQLLDCPQTAARLTDRIGGRPLAVFRVGRPLAEPIRSARLPAQVH
ncbi:nitroreductase family protein [Dactylosporangium fulvum]|uniref:Nitroreductase n=1 Tax=Dactylosporangium fulvum TaxID=53359 RepID=A0ABY5WAZ3_9ACTN|nr:hypothetical protein [Dactylosporangium fulvum]UWP87032.1 hypothetical protein Dfulv_23435 [Dactylosporangium fulvum]